jgi:STE24 endopeptidase
MARAPTGLAAAVALILAAEVALAPLSAAVSRTVEHRTDVRSVVLSADPQAHVALLRAFVIDGLAEPDPPRWSVLLWATHPTPAQRIRAVGAVEVPGPISFGDEPASTDHATR